MKIRYIITSLLLVLGIACSDDQGNYDYRELNTITLDGLVKDYYVDQYDTLKINDLNMNFALDSNVDLAFEWVVKTKNKDTRRVVSTDHFCNGYITETPGGYDAWVCVTDRSNNLKYYQKFNLTVNSPFQNALYVLSEAKDGSAILSLQRRDKENAPLQIDLFEGENPGLGQLGKKPIQISYYWGTVYAVCQEGERKLLKINPKTLQLQQYWDETTIDEGYVGSFVPEFFTNDLGGGMVLSEGKLFLFNYMSNGTLYFPIEGYNFSWVGTNPGESNSYYYAYDEDSQTFKKLEKGNNPLLFNKVSTVEELNTAGQTYWAQGAKVASDYDKTRYPILLDQATGMEHYYEIYCGGDYDEDWNYIKEFRYSEVMNRQAVLDENSVCLLSNANYWYASKGNKIVRYFFSATSEVKDWFTDFKGEVTNMMFDSKEDRIFVATFDGTKSYIYEISTIESEEQLNAPLELTGKVVSMCVVGKWMY